MFNHNRGLWGYTGPSKRDGEPLSIQSTGMGGPSAAIVAHELVALGARRLLRVGTCGALAQSLALGDLVNVTEALAGDGASQALGATQRVAPDPGLREALGRAGESLGAAGAGIYDGAVLSSDLFYDERALEPGWVAAGAVAVEMECAALFTVARRAGVQAAAVLLVTDLRSPTPERIDDDALHAGELMLGTIATAALQSSPSQ
jgi:uridine phosphorylase